MDPLTQGLLGACVGQAVCGRRLGGRAVLWGALVGMAPDLDVVMNLTSPTAEWVWHRGPTHALWFGPVVGPAVGWLLWRWKGGQLRDWTVLGVLALVTHPLLDAFTTYGTQLLTPFSSVRVSWDAVAVIDPLYSLVLAAALLVAWRRGADSVAARRAGWSALALSSAYLALGLWVNDAAERRAFEQLAAEGLSSDDVQAYPTMFQLPLRRVVARSGNEVRIGWTSALVRVPIEWRRFEGAAGPLVQAARSTREGRLFEWFASGQTAARVEPSEDGGAIVEVDDMRYGLPGDPRDGLWGVRVRFDAEGRLDGMPERFDRPIRLPASQVLGAVVKQTIGAGRRPEATCGG